MSLECMIELEYDDSRKAETVKKAIELDNEGYATAEVKGRRVIIRSSSDTIPSMLHTLEDLLACVKVAEETMNIAGNKSPGNALPDLDR